MKKFNLSLTSEDIQLFEILIDTALKAHGSQALVLVEKFKTILSKLEEVTPNN